MLQFVVNSRIFCICNCITTHTFCSFLKETFIKATPHVQHTHSYFLKTSNTILSAKIQCVSVSHSIQGEITHRTAHCFNVLYAELFLSYLYYREHDQREISIQEQDIQELYLLVSQWRSDFFLVPVYPRRKHTENQGAVSIGESGEDSREKAQGHLTLHCPLWISF
jgi:hypothetical protein